MAGVAGQPRTVLLATEKAFAKDAVEKIENIFKVCLIDSMSRGVYHGHPFDQEV